MKITQTIIKEVEIEIDLPVFKKRVVEVLDKTEYTAYYGESHNDNFQFTIERGNIGSFNNFAFIRDFNEGEQITFDEFSEALNEFNELWYSFYSKVEHDAKGEYYVEDECSTKHEDGGDEGYNAWSVEFNN